MKQLCLNSQRHHHIVIQASMLAKPDTPAMTLTFSLIFSLFTGNLYNSFELNDLLSYVDELEVVVPDNPQQCEMS